MSISGRGARTKRIAVVAALLCAAVMAMRAPVAAAAESPIGAHAMLQLNFPPSFLEAMFREAAAMHASTLRMDIAPSIVFTDPSQPPDFSGLDEVMTLAQKYHLRVVGDLFTIPPWIANCQAPTDPPQAVRCGTDDLSDYGSMISQIVAHADPVIRDWEIWNEPDTGFFFSGTPQQYARMLQTAHDSIKQMDPQANVLLGGISGAAGTSWLTQVFATPGVDAAHDFDIANVHERSWLTSLAGDLGTWKQFLAGYGFSGPLWVTEHGYPSDPAYQYDPSYTTGPGAQAAYLTASVPTLIEAGASEVFVTERDNLSGQYASEGVLGGDVLDPPVEDPQAVEKPSYAYLRGLASCYQATGHDCPGSAPVASPESVPMRPTQLGSSAASSITISHTGLEPLQIGSLALGQVSGSGISLRSDGCSNQIVEPNRTCTVVVAFTPTGGGAASALLQIPSDQGTLTVPISGVAPSVSSLSSPQLPVPRFKPISADGVGYRQRLALVLADPLIAPVHVAETSLSGADSGGFTIESSQCTAVTLAPAGSCRISLLFKPTRVGTASALLTLSGEGLPLKIPLSATAFPVPRIGWVDLRTGRRCLTTGPRERVRVLVNQPSRLKWSIEPAPANGGARCGGPGQQRGGGRGRRAGRSSARGHVVTGGREKTVLGRHGFLASFLLPSTAERRGLRAGTYRLTLIASSPHGTSAARAISLAVVG